MNIRIVTATAFCALALFSSQALADRQSARDSIAEARALISASERTEAASLSLKELKSARDFLDTAETQAEKRNFTEAEDAATRSASEAELAGAKARAMAAEEALAEMREVVAALRSELER